jgi:hypothetical protein
MYNGGRGAPHIPLTKKDFKKSWSPWTPHVPPKNITKKCNNKKEIKHKNRGPTPQDFLTTLRPPPSSKENLQTTVHLNKVGHFVDQLRKDKGRL